MIVSETDVTLIFRSIYYENPVFMGITGLFYVKMLRM